MPNPQSVAPALVASASCSSASRASWVFPVLVAASISSGSAHADGLQLPDENRLPGLIVPELARGPPGRIPPSRSLIHRGLFLGKDARRAPQHWRRCDASFADQYGKAVQ